MVELYNLFLTALNFFPNCCMTKKRWDKAVNTYDFTIQFVPDCYKAQEMCDKAAIRYFLHLFLFLINIKYKKCVIVFLKGPFLIVYCLNKGKTQKKYSIELFMIVSQH